MRIIVSFPNIYTRLLDNRILQIYSCDNCFIAMIGRKGYELPYVEQEYLEIEGMSQSDSVIVALQELDY